MIDSVDPECHHVETDSRGPEVAARPSGSTRRRADVLALFLSGAGAATAVGALLPWATIWVTSAPTDLLGPPPTISLQGTQLDASFAAIVLVCGGIAAILGLLLLADHGRLRPLALIAIVAGPSATVACGLGVQKALNTAGSFLEDLGPVGFIGSLVEEAGIVHVDPGIGVVLSALAGVAVALCGLLLYRLRWPFSGGGHTGALPVSRPPNARRSTR